MKDVLNRMMFLLGFLVLFGLTACAPKPDGSGLGDVRQPIQVNLQQHEDAGGHTIARHVAKDDNYLSERLDRNLRLDTVSTFSSYEVAEASVNAVLNSRRQEVADWWRGDLARQAFFARVPTHGRYLTRQMWQDRVEAAYVPDQAVVRVVLVRRGDGFYVLTAFPQPDK
ncbi:RNase A-like domain-containing protein [Thiomicrospira microaerophila]|uniref:RNase A-like domain-containing protein n=1 Tax=Thiomicrospira microaerophila TaxID=406020 RepID=UPI00200F1E35|nr:RNase A-like domain-containing protein [Thiomicrospira microaerophila]